MLPRIAIPLPTCADLAYNRRNWNAFATAVREADGEPVEFALDLDDRALASLAGTCRGVVLPGSPADVDPASYGHSRDPATAPADPARERTDRFLLEYAAAHRLPVLGVCFGAQMMNTVAGGTLIQDLAVMPVNHAASAAVAVAHSVSIVPGSRMESLTDPGECTHPDHQFSLPVNSSHHQALGIAGIGLRVSARCPLDGVIEAIERPGEPLWLGVQWHPERTTATSTISRRLFAHLVEQAATVLVKP